MKKFFHIICVIFFSVSIFSTYAQENVTDSSIANKDELASSLEIISAQPSASRVVEVTFNENVVLDSVRVTVENQKTKQFVKVKEYLYSEYGNTVVKVILWENLDVNTTYTLIVNSVISEKNNTIKDGIDAIRDFITPDKFAEDAMSFDAPSNEAAVIIDNNSTPSNEIEDKNANTTVVTQEISNESQVNNKWESHETNSIKDTKELPTAGSETIILFVLFLVTALVILGALRKKSV